MNWKPSATGYQALVTGSPEIDQLGLCANVHAVGDMALEVDVTQRVPLKALSLEAQKQAQARSTRIKDVAADCKKVRKCLRTANPAVKDIASPARLYSARVCQATAASVCRPPTPPPSASST